MSDDDPDAETVRAKAHEVAGLVDKIRPLLAGHDVGVQGGALADLTSMWLVGHPDFIREDMLAFQMMSVMNLEAVNERILFNGKGHPQNKRKKHDRKKQ